MFRNEQVPCLTQINDTGDGPDKFIACTWTKPPDDLLNRIWAPVDPSCSYVPGQSSTVWTFSCSAGVDPVKSIGDNSWGSSYAGNPDPYNAPDGSPRRLRCAGGSAGADRARPAAAGAPARRARPRAGARQRHPPAGGCGWRARRSSWTGCCSTGAAARAGATARPSGTAVVEADAETSCSGRFTAATTGRRERARHGTAHRPEGRARLTLNVGAATFRAPRVCHALPASVAIDTPPL